MRSKSAIQPSGATKLYMPLEAPVTQGLLNGCVANYKLEDTSDSVGTYTLTNNGTVTFVSGFIGNCADFGTSNTNKSLSRTDSSGLGTGESSVSLWVKIRTEISAGSYCLFASDTTNGKRFAVYYEYNGGTRRLNLQWWNAANNYSATYNITLGTSNWYHIVITGNNSSTCYLYLNGAQVASVAVGATGTFGLNNRTYIGCLETGSYSNAYIDEVVLYNKVVSAEQITALYNAGNGIQLDNRVVDYSGNANHGTPTAITYAQGKFGQCASFNGSTSLIAKTSASGISRTGANEITVSAWIKVGRTAGQFQQIVCNRDATLNWSLYMHQTIGAVSFYGAVQNAGTFVPTLNQWTHVLATVDSANTLKIYANGVLRDTVASYAYGSTTSALGIGQISNGGEAFLGLIDEVIIESRAWSASEVATYYRKSVLNYKPVAQRGAFAIFVAYLMSVSNGPFTLTGIDMLVHRLSNLTTQVGQFTLTGIDTIFKRGKGMAVAVGQFALTGISANVNAFRRITTAVGAYTLTGINATFIKAKLLLASVGQFILSGLPIKITGTGNWTISWKSTNKGTSTFTSTTKSTPSSWTPTNKSN